jgi:hypothetical protein
MSIFQIMELEAKRNTVYNVLHISMVNNELDNMRKIDILEIEREESHASSYNK